MKTKTKQPQSVWLAVLALAVLVAVLFLTGIPQQKYKERSLASFYDQMVQWEKDGDWPSIYNALTYEQRREMSVEEWSAERGAEPRPLSMEFTVHGVTVDGDRGFVDRTLLACFSEVCEGDDRFEERAVKEYLYINGAWYAPKSNSLDDEGNPFETEFPDPAAR